MDNPSNNDAPKDKPHRTFVEEIEVTGGQLLDKVKDLIRTGNVRRLRIRAGEDFTLEMPVTVGAIAGGVVVLAAPWLAIIGVIAAMMTKVKIEVERETDHPDARPPETRADTPPDA
ncbi:DUF4342 domain-containing protein [Paracoccaceae bacterium Fryx2]|nr:DUF4342 domain-containing protein [Paracoccaceae bacterium Fryx2]